MQSLTPPPVTLPSTIMLAEILLQDVVKDGWFGKKPVEWCGTGPLVGSLELLP